MATRAVPIWALQVIVAVMLCYRIAYLVMIAPVGDEAYYWIWGQHLELSYYDHPPLQAWLMGLISHLFGWSQFTLRLLGQFTLGGTVWIFYLWARRLAPDNWQEYFWITLAIYLSTPVFAIFSVMMFPDHLLILFSLIALFYFSRFIEAWDSEAAPPWHDLLIAAAALGLAALSKYTAVFVATGFALALLSTARRRRLLLEWRVYGAAMVTLLFLTPVLWWNFANGWVSLKYHLADRQHFDLGDGLSAIPFRDFINNIIQYCGPFLIIPMVRVLLMKPQQPFERAAKAMATSSFGSSMGTFSGLTLLGSRMEYYWNMVSYVALLPLLARTMGASMLLVGHFLYGATVMSMVIVNQGVVPLATLRGDPDWEAVILHGWPIVNAEFAEAEAEVRPDFLVATRYTLAAQLAFQRGRNDVTALATRIDQYDYWFDPAVHEGQTALILGDITHPVEPEIAAQFESVEVLRTFEIRKFGYLLNTFVLYVGRDYRGPPATDIGPRVKPDRG